MRRPVYTATFVEDADKIAHYIETRFEITYADAFIASLNRFCEIVASQPGLEKQNHGYDATLYGVVHDGIGFSFSTTIMKRGSFMLSMLASTRRQSFF